MIDENGLYGIGELAKRTGVAVKTIRHYTDEGILPPSGTTAAGYRRYSDEDARRLRRIRSLRALGFSLPAIGSMLDGARDPRDVAKLQLDLVDTQLRALERQRSILRNATAAASQRDLLTALDAAFAAAELGAAERAHRLERWLERATTVDSGQRAQNALRGMVLDNLPSELSVDRLGAWVRLSALLDDPEFLAVLAEQHRPFGDAAVSPQRQAEFGAGVSQIVGQAVALVREGANARDERVLPLARRWEALFATALGRRSDAAFRSWFLDYAARTNDPRIERFWNDVAELRAGPAMPPFTAATNLLIDALREDPEARAQA
ncbi:MAG TPA: MerR family transcriptional regulator [Candidatus Acidoferrales bacterium]|nr:MerR family transcriptional regulator [Candidatus Acidoferrales bacterium]